MTFESRATAEPYRAYALIQQPQLAPRGFGQVDDSPTHERATVVDAHADRTTILQ